MIQRIFRRKIYDKILKWKEENQGKTATHCCFLLHDTIHLRNKVREHSLLLTDFSDLLFLLKPANSEGTWHPPKDFDRKLP